MKGKYKKIFSNTQLMEDALTLEDIHELREEYSKTKAGSFMGAVKKQYYLKQIDAEIQRRGKLKHEHIGRPVWQVWGGILRLGQIHNTFVQNRWRYYEVDWDDDREADPVRCDHVSFADLDRISVSINKMLERGTSNDAEG